MKVGILTFHRAINYGAVLQLYGLYSTLKNLGAEVDVIDYRASFNEKRFEKKKLRELLQPRMLYTILFRNGYQSYDRESFHGFLGRMTTSPICYSREDLESCCKEYDRIFVGSDQVWNLGCTEGDDSFLLPFAIPSFKKVSYAASIAYQKIPNRYLSLYRTALSDFSCLSVREKNSVGMIEKLTGKKVFCHMDPSMLLDAEKWEMLADCTLVPAKPYLLLYVMSEDQVLLKKAREIAKQNGLEIIYINNRLFKMWHATNYSQITPEQWLGLFLRASFLCVNSFHGLAFAINFNKPFIVKLIHRSIANSRLKSILDEYKLTSQLVENYEGNMIDYTAVNERIDDNRKQALKYLKQIIN